MVTQTQEEQPSEWKLDLQLQRLWTRLAGKLVPGREVREGGQPRSVQGEDQGVLQEGHLIWGETIIGVGIVN